MDPKEIALLETILKDIKGFSDKQDYRLSKALETLAKEAKRMSKVAKAIK